MKVLNAPEYAEVVMVGKKLFFTDKLEIKEDGYVIELKRVSKPSIETEAVELNVKENKVEVGKYEIELDNHIGFTIKGIRVDVYKLFNVRRET
jgi:hypothetical protein